MYSRKIALGLLRALVDAGLARFELPAVPVHAVWPATSMLAPKTQLFVDFLAGRLKAAWL